MKYHASFVIFSKTAKFETIEFLKFSEMKKSLAYKILEVCEVNIMYIGFSMCACRAKYRLDYMHQ